MDDEYVMLAEEQIATQASGIPLDRLNAPTSYAFPAATMGSRTTGKCHTIVRL